MKFPNVIVFKNHNGNNSVVFENPVPVLANFDSNIKIGSATVTHIDGITYADITLDVVVFKKAWPAVGGNYEPGKPFEILSIGLCSNPNVDGSIEPISVPETKE